jgi:hypothetical protein
VDDDEDACGGTVAYLGEVLGVDVLTLRTYTTGEFRDLLHARGARDTTDRYRRYEELDLDDDPGDLAADEDITFRDRRPGRWVRLWLGASRSCAPVRRGRGVRHAT